MITDKDITKLKKVFATKDDLAGIKSDIVDLRSDMLRQKGDILGELSKTHHAIMRDLEQFFHDSFMPVLEGHDKRITRLEKHAGLPKIAD
jgi:hypothetical protein